MTRRLAAAAALAFALAACGSILPKPAEPPLLFRLTPLARETAAAPTIDAQLVVELPAAPAALDTERVALTRGPLSFDYFANAAWVDRAPAMLQSLMIESLANAGQIRVVARPSGELRADATLMTDLRQFEAEYRGNEAPAVHVRFDCRIVRTADRAVLATTSFEGTASAAANTTPDIIAAFDDALHRALGGLPQWTAGSLATLRR